MAKSALLKSSLAKKYWMALTGLFLCVFLVGHLAGNLQLIFADASQFNQYALFMTTNPAVKVLSYLTYFSIVFHAIDGILLAFQNKKARPVKYAYERQEANTNFPARNMAVLGTLLLVFIVTHMIHFWAPMHFDKKMPLQTISVDGPMQGMKTEYYVTSGFGREKFLPVEQVNGEELVREGADFYLTKPVRIKFAQGYKDLHKITVAFFKDEKLGLVFTILYVISMGVLGFHLYHGFASAFQSMGWNNRKYNSGIKTFGRWFSVVVPLLFAIIPIYIHFFLKA